MAHTQFTVVQDFPQPLSAVFAHMAHHDNLAVLFGVPVRRIRESPDPAEPNGLGSVRVVAIGPVKIEETITVFEKDRLIEYRITRGGFMKHHRGELRFSAQGDGARVEYQLELESALPLMTGPILKGLQKGISRGLRRLSTRSAL
jgi:hypothetical protein